jgi:hypothetical protein
VVESKGLYQVTIGEKLFYVLPDIADAGKWGTEASQYRKMFNGWHLHGNYNWVDVYRALGIEDKDDHAVPEPWRDANDAEWKRGGGASWSYARNTVFGEPHWHDDALRELEEILVKAIMGHQASQRRSKRCACAPAKRKR